MSSSARARAAVPRRTVATGLAWAVPAVLLVAGAPAYAASGDIVKVLDSSVACKITGTTKRYQFTLVFQNTGTTTTTLCVTAGQMITNGANCDDPNVDPTVLPRCVDVTAGTTVSLKGGTTWTALSGTVSATTIPAGSCVDVLFTGTFQDASAPSSGTATLTTSYTWTSGTGGTAQSGTQTATASLTITGC